MSIATLQILNHACQLAGLIDTDESVDGDLGAVSLIKLNELLQQLCLNQLFPFSQNIVNYSIVTDTHSLTIGNDSGAPVADIVQERPLFIERILYLSNQDANPCDVMGIDLPDLLTIRKVNSIGNPSCFAVNQTYPSANILFDRKLQAGSEIVIVYNKAMPVLGINDEFNVPLEYHELAVTGLARSVGVLKKIPAEVLASINTLFKDAKLSIQRNNSRRQIPMMGLTTSGSPYSFDGFENMR